MVLPTLFRSPPSRPPAAAAAYRADRLRYASKPVPLVCHPPTSPTTQQLPAHTANHTLLRARRISRGSVHANTSNHCQNTATSQKQPGASIPQLAHHNVSFCGPEVELLGLLLRLLCLVGELFLVSWWAGVGGGCQFKCLTSQSGGVCSMLTWVVGLGLGQSWLRLALGCVWTRGACGGARLWPPRLSPGCAMLIS
jgi:hypothetical protein